MIPLITPRLTIRLPKPEDAGDWHRLFSNPETMHYVPDRLSPSPDHSRRALEAAMAEASNPHRTKYFFVLEHNETGAFVGTAGYTVTQAAPVGKFVDAGYFILPEYHGQGLATEAFYELIRFAFEEDGVYRISASCDAKNHASERVMQKCGLIKEAEYASCGWHNGRLISRLGYRLLRDEWKKTAAMNNCDFWQALDKLVAGSVMVIDRPKGSTHPRYADFIYPLDYGYLKNTTSMDGGGIDIWRGSEPSSRIDAIMCIIDLTKRDSEIKILIGCNEEEKALVFRTHNETAFMKGMMIRRALPAVNV